MSSKRFSKLENTLDEAFALLNQMGVNGRRGKRSDGSLDGLVARMNEAFGLIK